MSKPALWATRWSPSAKSTRSGSCSAQPAAPTTSAARSPWMRVFHSLNSSCPSGGWISQPVRSTTRPARTLISPTEQADALLEFAVSKSIAVKSSGTVPWSHARPTRLWRIAGSRASAGPTTPRGRRWPCLDSNHAREKRRDRPRSGVRPGRRRVRGIAPVVPASGRRLARAGPGEARSRPRCGHGQAHSPARRSSARCRRGRSVRSDARGLRTVASRDPDAPRLGGGHPAR